MLLRNLLLRQQYSDNYLSAVLRPGNSCKDRIFYQLDFNLALALYVKPTDFVRLKCT